MSACALGTWQGVLLHGTVNVVRSPCVWAFDRHLACGLSRYLVETPANICTPEYLADTAARIAALAPERFQLDVLERPAVEELGMGFYLGVAQVRRSAAGLQHALGAHACHSRSV